MIISDETYFSLRKAEFELEALRIAGVDNWEGYSIAMESLEENDEYQDFLSDYEVEEDEPDEEDSDE